MLFAILRFLRLCVPYGLLVLFYRTKKAVPTNLRTYSGVKLRAYMLTENYGLLFSESKYIKDRTKKLMERQRFLNKQNEELAKEFNALSFEARESLFSKPGEDE